MTTYSKFIKLLNGLKGSIDVTKVKEYHRITNAFHSRPVYTTIEEPNEHMPCKLTIHCPCCGVHSSNWWDKEQADLIARDKYHAVPAKVRKCVTVTFEFPEDGKQ